LKEEMARKTWVLDTDTKGTGAQMVPLDKALERKEPEPRKPAASKPAATPPTEPRPRRREAPKQVRRTSTPLGPGQVRKKSTGEIGKIQSVDPKAGTATVRWLREGRTSTVPLSAVTRK
jgi:hypothetical protein